MGVNYVRQLLWYEVVGDDDDDDDDVFDDDDDDAAEDGCYDDDISIIMFHSYRHISHTKQVEKATIRNRQHIIAYES